MRALRVAVVALVIAIAVPVPGLVHAATLHGLVFDDANGDGQPSEGEPGIANAVVALGVTSFVVTDASGQFDVDGGPGIVWVRVPDGFTPGPVWAHWDGKADVDLALHRRAPSTGPLTFVVAADTHIAVTQDFITGADLANVASSATALDPAPAFFTILGDITQGNRDAEFQLVDGALSGIGVPFIPVPGNHDWYDEGKAWFAHYGPDNYSFDLDGVHFVVWNMAMHEHDIRDYLGAELARVDRKMPIVALTHAPPSEAVTATLRELGVDYILTGHAHSNRVVDHDGLIELNTEPLLMGGLDFTPGGYRVMTMDGPALRSTHRTTVDEPFVQVMPPACGSQQLVVAADAADNVSARVDCATPIAMRPVGGWDWAVTLPPLSKGAHGVEIVVTTASGQRVTRQTTFETCAASPAPAAGDDWDQLGGSPSHGGARGHEVRPPLTTRWTTTVGGHLLTAPPVIAGGRVFVAVTDLGDGNTGGVVAIDLATGAVRWRVATPIPIRGGLAVVDGIVVAPQIDGVELGLDATAGVIRWRHELSLGIAAQAGAAFAPPATDGGDVLVGHQRSLAALAATTGSPLWTADPVPDGEDSQSAAALAIGDGIAVGTFNRALGGVIAWDRETGKRLWSYTGSETVAINASPVIDNDQIFTVSGADEVTAFDHAGTPRWTVKLDEAGFDWGNATVGTPALARNILVVPTLYRDVVALDAATGTELWRHAATPGPLRTTHYRSGREAGFAASPVITGDIVWTVDTSGSLTALELMSGRVVWQTPLGVPVLAGLAVSGDWLVAASYDGTVRALTPTTTTRISRPLVAPTCTEPTDGGGCCNARGSSTGWLVVLVAFALRRRRR
jgi:outer membrane protein assembly factor BamB/predicted phosphodiesterase